MSNSNTNMLISPLNKGDIMNKWEKLVADINELCASLSICKK